MADNHAEILGLQLRRIRTLAHCTREHLAELLGVSITSIARWEAGIISPRADRIPTICQVLACSADELFGLSEITAHDHERGLVLAAVRSAPIEHVRVAGRVLSLGLR